jgi:LysR family glycine cleavage system transcriptional activator
MSDRVLMPPLGSIRVFEAAARLGSFTRAAEELGMTQAAVSYQVKALEDRLGVAMFRRLPRQVELTSAGERLYRAASEAMTAIRSAVAELTETAGGVLAVTTLNTFASHWLVHRLGAFHLRHPDVAVRLDTSARLVDLRRETFDVAIRAGSGTWPGLSTHFLLPSIYTPLCSPAWLEKAGLGSPADLLEAERIGDPQEWAAWFAAAGVEGQAGRVRPAFMADTQQFEVTSAMQGVGVALGSPILFAADIAAGRLAQPFETVVASSGGYWVAYDEERRRSPKIAAFRDWILAAAAEDPAVARYRTGAP